jgi:hypothetical protein
VPSLSEDLRSLSVQLLKLSQATKREDDKNEESSYSYYYSKGALDYRDKLLELIGNMSKNRSALDVYFLLLDNFPDSYSGK